MGNGTFPHPDEGVEGEPSSFLRIPFRSKRIGMVASKRAGIAGSKYICVPLRRLDVRSGRDHKMTSNFDSTYAAFESDSCWTRTLAKKLKSFAL